jgi:hypothetical protein
MRLRLFGVRVTGNHPVLYLAGRSGRLLELHFKDAEIHFLFESVAVRDSRTVVDFEVLLDGQSFVRSIGPADCEPGDVLTFAGRRCDLEANGRYITYGGSLMTLPKISEKAFQAQVKELSGVLRVDKFYHPWLSKFSARGFPDLTIVKGDRLIFAELKAEKGKVTPEQSEWLDILGGVKTVEAYLWRPDDLQTIADILRG